MIVAQRSLRLVDKEGAYLVTSTAKMRISAIVCTRNRAESLLQSLEAIRNLRLSNSMEFELVVVDNNSTDDTKSVVSNFASAASFQVRYAKEDRPGLSAARNKGIALSCGDLIIFTDDDCLVSADWIEQAVLLFDHNLHRLVGGRVNLHNETHLDVTTKTSEHREELGTPNQLIGFAHGANMAFGRSVYELIGGFDTRLGAGTKLLSAEDSDFIYRAYMNQVPISYEPSLQVSHNHGRRGARELYRLTYGYAVGNSAMLAKHMMGGKLDLLRPLYWDLRNAIRDWRLGRASWHIPAMKVLGLTGAVHFLIFDSRKRPY